MEEIAILKRTDINEKTYLTKRTVPEKFKKNIKKFVIFDDKLPQWNYFIKYKPL